LFYGLYYGVGGAGGTRTPYLRLAKAALSQMSYSPKINEKGAYNVAPYP
tara:strand:+ start:8664 stop:8810 length:147 start_codon:yes stop_codon:yes gene_type:complete